GPRGRGARPRRRAARPALLARPGAARGRRRGPRRGARRRRPRRRRHLRGERGAGPRRARDPRRGARRRARPVREGHDRRRPRGLRLPHLGARPAPGGALRHRPRGRALPRAARRDRRRRRRARRRHRLRRVAAQPRGRRGARRGPRADDRGARPAGEPAGPRGRLPRRHAGEPRGTAGRPRVRRMTALRTAPTRQDVTAYGPMAPPVHVRDLRVTLGSARILQGIDLDVHDGEFVALLGANGSGKSTLVKSLLTVTPVTSGTVELFGVDVRDARHVPWRRVGYVPQRVGAASGTPATALEVVSSGLLDNRRLRPPRRWRDRALEALDEVGLADRAGETVSVFSGGQQQRVLIARALVRRPDLLVLDEPLAGIDRDSQESLAATLTGLRERGTSVLVVLHELG